MIKLLISILLVTNIFNDALQATSLNKQLNNLHAKLNGLNGQLKALKQSLQNLRDTISKPWKSVDKSKISLGESTNMNIAAASKQANVYLGKLDQYLSKNSAAEALQSLEALTQRDKLETIKYQANTLASSSHEALQPYMCTFETLEALADQVIKEKFKPHVSSPPVTSSLIPKIEKQLTDAFHKAKGIKSTHDLASLFTIKESITNHEKINIVEKILDNELFKLKVIDNKKFNNNLTRIKVAAKIVALNLDNLISLATLETPKKSENELQIAFNQQFDRSVGAKNNWYNLFKDTFDELILQANPETPTTNLHPIAEYIEKLRQPKSSGSTATPSAKPAGTKKEKPIKTNEEMAEALKTMLASENFVFTILQSNINGITTLTEQEKKLLETMIINNKDKFKGVKEQTLSSALQKIGLTNEAITTQGLPPPITHQSVGNPPPKKSGTSSGASSSGDTHNIHHKKDQLIELLGTKFKTATTGTGGPPPPPPPPPPPSGSGKTVVKVPITAHSYDLTKGLTADEIEFITANRAGIEKLSDLQRAGLKDFVTAYKHLFETSDEGKEVLTALAIT